MGTAASIFDCAVNPLNPLPENSAAEETAAQETVQAATSLKDSIIWQFQRDFYEDRGMSAWSDSIVPNFVTSNSFIAHAYARVLLAALKDIFADAPTAASASGKASLGIHAAHIGSGSGVDRAAPVYIIEVGAGHGKLGYLIVECLMRYRVFFPHTTAPFPFKYVMTDAIRGNVEAWLKHPSLKEFLELGMLDVAVFDAEVDTQVRSSFHRKRSYNLSM